MRVPFFFLVPLLFSGSAESHGPRHRALPDGLPSDALLATWEKVDGWVEEADRDTRYTLWVDPRYPALYRLTHYQVSVPVAGSAERAVQLESLLWNETPGRRAPLACYSWKSSAGASGPLGVEGAWERLTPDTDTYRTRIWEVLRVYDLHRKVRLQQSR